MEGCERLREELTSALYPIVEEESPGLFARWIGFLTGMVF